MNLCPKILQLVNRKVHQLLFKHKTALPVKLKGKLTRYPSKPPHLYGVSEIHKLNISFSPIVSSIGSPCYALAGFLHNTLSPLTRKSELLMKNSDHFIQLLKSVNLQNSDALICSGAVGFFTNMPLDKTVTVIRVTYHNGHIGGMVCFAGDKN
ncbi:hypothetical protein L798_06938 [Zootermopsis nevadensis]|uniref:Uncharacterized protein n=1 Tax=Zootermopsis nevadensis TaxID=136037 RepID=A0A067R4X4_ZOONE|nr:hypothetical protein L798_06938 [Zootermopsis nevadensis]